MKAGVFPKQLEHVAQAPGDLLAEQQGRHHGFESGMRIGVVDSVDGAQVGLVMGGQRSQGLKVVAHDFGGNVLHHGLLR